MKKLYGVIMLLIICLNTSHADEGMWIIEELNKQNRQRMEELGFMPGKGRFIANSVVIFGRGCTGITVSDEGLIFTNHHCGYGSIQKLSSVEHDYLKDGFISQSFSEELPVDGLTVHYLKETVDVTDSIIPRISHIDDEYERITAADSIGKILETAVGKTPFLKASVLPFYSMNKYYLVVYHVYRDVRLVFAPPSSVGKFGGDTDNWMWPRHTGDFAAFRVYADAENMPAEYSENNRPYKPKFVANISTRGYQENDFAMTIGFPGRTDRYLSSWGVEQRIESQNKPRIEVRGIKQEIWKKAMQSDDAIRIKYASKYAGSSNYWKNSIGMNRGLARLKIIERKQKEEKQFNEWAQLPENKNTYGKVLDFLEEGYRSTDDKRKNLTYLLEAFSSGTEIIRLARTFSQIDNKNLSNDEITEILNERIRPFFKDYDAELDQKVLAKMMKVVKDRVRKEYLPDIYEEVDKKFKGNYERYAAYLFSKTALLSEHKISDMLKNKRRYKKYMKKDPAAKLSLSVTMAIMELRQDIGSSDYEIKKGRRLYFSGIQKMYPDSVFYSDANFTMRMSYGTIGGYHPFDAAWYDHYTTDKGLLEKENPLAPDFWIQPEITSLIRKGDFGSYANAEGRLQLCFLSNNDITGGNSGSPVFDKNGHVIGLAFDGNWEAMSGDIAFEPELQRTISVDMRYMLWIIEKWGKCDRLIKELKIKH